ncbi:MAG: UTP--glucose-1-phosphate uridylyltransferase [Ruminococcus sp.]|nr:UTP--glucose-1-phosphate uridylyltransferase [Ruminococcus sp.]
MNYTQAKQLLDQYGQSHVLKYYDTLSPSRQQHLLEQIENLNLYHLHFQNPTASTQKRGTFAPMDAVMLDDIRKNQKKYRDIGIQALREAKVGAVLLAGGQGSRLGFNHPKGTFNIGKTRDLYIFQCLIQNLKKVTDEVDAYVPLLIMTNEDNDAETKAFLQEHDFFGYSKDNVEFFTQETEPVISEEGKLFLKTPDEIIRTPNGNGGWFLSMYRAGMMHLIEDTNIEWLNVFAVDNVMQQIADPIFLGAVIDSGCVSGGKVVSKTNPDERIGVLCLEDGKPSIVEYYEMTEEMRILRNSDGTLAYRFGVILNYLFHVDALKKTLQSDFPLHVVHKKIPYMGEDGIIIKPDKPNAYKFETLVLDMVHMQDSYLAFEVERIKEFAPIKNAVGVDSVETAQAILEQNGIVL